MILYIGNNLNDVGGLPTGLNDLGENLRKEGFDLKTASDKKNKILRLFEMVLLVVRNSREAEFVLIDTYSTSNFWYAYFISILCQILHLKYIPILHGGELPIRIKRSPSAAKTIFKNAFCSIAPSQYLFEFFKNAGYSNIEFIPNSINILEYPYKDRQEFEPNLLWVRAFAEIYNPMLALKVLQLLLKKFPDAQLTMVGPVKDHSWEKCKKYALDHSLPVKFTGKLQKKEWLELSQNSDIFINTTNIDNTPVSIIEAMALGIPVVSTRVGGLPFLLSDKENALLVPPNDPRSMALAVEEVILYAERSKEMVLKARLKAESFDWNLVRSRWLKILQP